ncbi:MAG: peptidoglycan DD-metalloendopeptidase family protein [Alphaproteobacteria bacterium]|nr:peptidoglycan DD-metalloendopeptidase family protein [Alphaproteobacteria bacterium]MDP7191648.1 peptidoglycan DD-metalloendopeptidase family protein [Alphaproteobacteria bacterium]
MRRSTWQAWLVCAVIGIGVYALSMPSTFHAEGALPVFFSDVGDTTNRTAVEFSAFQPSSPVIETPFLSTNGINNTIQAYTPPSREPHKPYRRTIKVSSGDTLSGILTDSGISTPEAQDAITAIRAVYNPRHLHAGQQITLTFSPRKNKKSNGNSAYESVFQSLSLSASTDHKVGVYRGKNGEFSSHEVKRKLKKELTWASGIIHASLAQAASTQGVPNSVLAEIVSAFSYDVDFQRDIQNNDSFEVMFEGLYDDKGWFVRNGKVMFASLTLSGVRMPIYRYKNSNGMTEFYNEKGESAQKALLRTPVDGARLVSRYGKRRHPILGYTKMHRGVDFAADKGAPIKAAGNGVIAKAGRNGAYGRYVKIRHNSEYSTAYGHLSRYKKGIRSGKRVKQGEIIGYVGSTGRSTGSHLHFEIIKHGKMINPLSVKLPSETKLTNNELKKFLATVNTIKRRYAQLPAAAKLVSRQ